MRIKENELLKANNDFKQCLAIKIVKTDSAGFNYSIINNCEKTLYLIRNFELTLEFENETNFQNPKISVKPLFPSVQWKNNSEREAYFNSNIDCGEIVNSIAPYYHLNKDSTIQLRFDFSSNRFQLLKKGVIYRGVLTLKIPNEYLSICPKLIAGETGIPFEWELN